MTNERIGSFIAATRREKKLTQEQLAEKLGVSNRSVSRWENGNTLPDLSLMQKLCEALDITISELIHGEKETQNMERKETVTLLLSLAEREKEQKAREVNQCLIPGTVLLAVTAGFNWFGGQGMNLPLELAMALLGMGLLMTGIFRNSRKQHITEREQNVLSATGDVRMTTAGEMIQFARKFQKPELKQQRQAFEAIAGKLEAGEYAVFAMTGSAYQCNDHPGPWHIAVALTDRRLLLCGEFMRGRLLTAYTPEWLNREEISSVEYKGQKILIHAEKNVVKIEGDDLAPLAEKLKIILKK